MNSFVRVFGM